MNQRILFFIFMFLPCFVLAGQAFENGNISFLLVHNGSSQPSDSANRVLVKLDSVATGGFCGEGNWTIVLNNDTAKAQYSFLLAAYMAGKKVRLTGNPMAVCDGTREIVRNVEFIN